MSLRKYGITEEVRAQKLASGLRWCSGHKDFLPAAQFSGTSGYCSECTNNWHRGRTDVRWKAHLKKTYGVSPEWYDQKLKEQGGVCAVCGRDNGKRRLAVDHNHQTGRPRGLLCTACNMALNRIESIPNWAARVQKYLQFDN